MRLDPNKAQDLEKKREGAAEGVRRYVARPAASSRVPAGGAACGFKTAWGRKDYSTIIKVAQKIPEEALQREKLLLWYDRALTRAEAGA